MLNTRYLMLDIQGRTAHRYAIEVGLQYVKERNSGKFCCIAAAVLTKLRKQVEVMQI